MGSQAALREEMEGFLQRVAEVLRARGRQQDGESSAAELVSALHIHVDLRQEAARDVVDYLRFQLEWCQRRLVEEIEAAGSSGCGTHVLALTVHGARGSADPDSCIRPFLFAGPPKMSRFSAGGSSSCDELLVETLQWQGVAVDHFAPHLPWDLTPEVIMHGSKAEILGVVTPGASGSSTDASVLTTRFQQLLLDALPHVVPLLSCTEDTVSMIHALTVAFRGSEHLTSLLQEHVRGSLDLREDGNWRVYVAKNMALLRRTGSFQLALLSSLRCDVELRPLLDAIWRHSLHTSCPMDDSGSGSSSRSTAWKAVADNILKEAAAAAKPGEPPSNVPLLSSQKQMLRLLAPGAPALLRRLLPLARATDLKRPTSERRDESVLAAVESLAIQMAEIADGHLPYPLLEALKDSAAEMSSSGGVGGLLGIFGEDAVTEAAASACQSLRSSQLFGRELQDTLKDRVRELAAWLINGGGSRAPPGVDERLVLALRPVAAAGLLLPVAEYIALVMANIRRAEHAAGFDRMSGVGSPLVWKRDAGEGLGAISDETTWLDVLSNESVSLLGSVARQLISSLKCAAEKGVPLDPGLHTLRRLSALVQTAPTASVAARPELLRVVVLFQMLCDASGAHEDNGSGDVLAALSDLEQPILSCLEELVSPGSKVPLAVALAGLQHVMTRARGDALGDAPEMSTALRLLNSLCQRAGASLPGDLPAAALSHIRQLALFVAGKLLDEICSDDRAQLPVSIALLADRAVEPGCRSEAVSFPLEELRNFLPPPRADAAWDHPFATVLADALLDSSQMVLGVAKRAKLALQFCPESEDALEVLVGAFRAACDAVEQPSDSVELLLGLALGRALAIQSVAIVADLRLNDIRNHDRFGPLRKEIRRLFFAEVVGQTDFPTTANGVELRSPSSLEAGRAIKGLLAQHVPPPFASLFVVTATKAPAAAQLDEALSTSMVRALHIFVILCVCLCLSVDGVMGRQRREGETWLQCFPIFFSPFFRLLILILLSDWSLVGMAAGSNLDA